MHKRKAVGAVCFSFKKLTYAKKSAGSGVHGKASTYRPAGSMPDVATFICSRCAHVQTVHTVPGVWYKVSYVVKIEPY
jgi:hypothetical protein